MSEITEDITPYKARYLTELHKDWEPIVQKELNSRVHHAAESGRNTCTLYFETEAPVEMTSEIHDVLKNIILDKGWRIPYGAVNLSPTECRIEIGW